MDGVIAKAISPEVGDRFRSVDEFFEALSLPSSVKLNYQEPPKQDDRAAVEARKLEEERIAAEQKVEDERIAREQAAAEKARAEKAAADKAAKEEQERRAMRVEPVVNKPRQFKTEYSDVVVVKPAGLFRREQTEVVRFASIPAGTFMMGSPEDEYGRSRDEAQHKVTLTSPFELMVTPVTQGLWRLVMGNNPSYFKGPDLPVESVSWDEVQDFIAKLNQMLGIDSLRLPTEAEWEYACRAGTTGARYAELDMIAWYDDNSACKTHPVGEMAPNAWGLYDMLGNVFEWCQDWYGDYPSGAVTDPGGPFTGSFRVSRGGSWYDNFGFVRAAGRYSDFVQRYRYFHLGFRLARDSL